MTPLDPLADVQALVLRGGGAHRHAQHALVHWPERAQASHLLLQLTAPLAPWHLATGDQLLAADTPQLGLGLTRAGLERLDVPAPALAPLHAQARAFVEGAAVRAARCLNDHGPSAAERWDWPRPDRPLHLVLTLHAADEDALKTARHQATALARANGAQIEWLVACAWLARPDGNGGQEKWVHFGYRDALSSPRIRDRDAQPESQEESRKTRWHAPGDFVLGQAQDGEANPWQLSTLPQTVRELYHGASFGVLRQVEQDEKAFHRFIDEAIRALDGQAGDAGLQSFVRAKLMGRWPAGQRLAKTEQPGCPLPTQAVGDNEEFDYAQDGKGETCPFSAHIRRMNPRESAAGLAHSLRQRGLLRRGMPYGTAYQRGEAGPPATGRGLMGLFFCASLEDQFEHVVGQWGAGVPLGSEDRGNAHDPFVAGQPVRIPDSDPDKSVPLRPQFVIPLADRAPLVLTPPDCVRTRGTAYLFYPSLKALRFLGSSELWQELRADEP